MKMKSEKLFEKISEIINSDFKNSFQGSNIILQDSSSKEVKINKTGTMLCIQLDRKNINLFPYFNKSIENLNKVPDRIIFYTAQNKLFVFIIELKSTNPSGAFKQVKSGYEICKFICNNAIRLLNYPSIEIEYRALIFSSNQSIKGTTQAKNLNYIDDPQSGLKHKHLPSGKTINLDSYSF